MPIVSVVIPTYNRRSLVTEAVRSVLEQSVSGTEVVVVDDGSTDGTASALRQAFGGAVRVHATANRGVSAARNTGVALGRAPYVAFLDSDDLWHPRKLAALHPYFEARPERQICQTEEIWVRDGRRVNPCRHHAKPEGDIFVPSLSLCLVSPSAVMMRRELFDRLGGFDETLPACEDYDLWLRVACVTPVGLVREPLVTRRSGHDDQLSRRYWGMDRFRIAALVKLLGGELAPPRRRAALEVLRRKCAIVASGAEKRGRREEAERYRRIAGIEERCPTS